jgi:hypothetical protein
MMGTNTLLSCEGKETEKTWSSLEGVRADAVLGQRRKKEVAAGRKTGPAREGRRTGQEKGPGKERGFLFLFYLQPFEIKLLFSFKFETGMRARIKTSFQNIYFICNPKQNTLLFKN